MRSKNKSGEELDPLSPPRASRAERIVEVQALIQYQFKNPELLVSALTHASSADSRVVSNERLEFLGDSILGLVICENLYLAHPELLEGELTKIKSVVVSRRTCSRISKTLGLDRFLIVGRGMASQASVPASVMADAFESLIAAIYLDGGLDEARRFVLRHTAPEMERAASGHHGGNYKSMLQQVSQRSFGTTPTYQTIEEMGPDHAKSFRVSAVIGPRIFPPAWGKNKKDAEQKAAFNALEMLAEPNSSEVSA